MLCSSVLDETPSCLLELILMLSAACMTEQYRVSPQRCRYDQLLVYPDQACSCMLHNLACQGVVHAQPSLPGGMQEGMSAQLILAYEVNLVLDWQRPDWQILAWQRPDWQMLD